MTPAQLEAIRREQAEQALLNKEIREAERSHDEVRPWRLFSVALTPCRRRCREASLDATVSFYPSGAQADGNAALAAGPAGGAEAAARAGGCTLAPGPAGREATVALLLC